MKGLPNTQDIAHSNMSSSKKPPPPPIPPRSTRPQRSRKDEDAPLPATPEVDWSCRSPEELAPEFKGMPTTSSWDPLIRRSNSLIDLRISDTESREARQARYARRSERTTGPSSSAQSEPRAVSILAVS